MTLARHAKRRDANEGDIVKALRKIGVWVHPIDTPFDLLCCYHGTMFGIEVKDGSKTPSQRPLTPSQKEFFDLAEVSQIPAVVCINVEQAVQAAQDFGR